MNPFPEQAIWHIPYERNAFFTGREEVLGKLYDQLNKTNIAAITQPQSVTGLGGIGKTQTVVEYAYRYRAEYQAVLWVRSDTQSVLISELITLAITLNLPEQHEQEYQQVIAGVMRWLKEHDRWLLIFDNVEDVQGIYDLLPTAYPGHILLTTRATAVGIGSHRIEVEKMSVDTGALLLLRRAAIVPHDAPLEHAKEDDRQLASDIARELDGLPLALDQAGAYIHETGCGLAGYLTLYQTRSNELLQSQSTGDYPHSVATTWSLAFEKVRVAQAAAIDFLSLCAFLHPDAIPEELFTENIAYLGPLLQPVAQDAFALNALFRELLRFSLIQRKAKEKIFTLHRLVQQVFRSGIEQETQEL